MNQNAITILEANEHLPEYIKVTLSTGPKHPVLTKFDEKATAAEVNELIEHHESLGMSQDIINDINIASYRYIKDVKNKELAERARTRQSI